MLKKISVILLGVILSCTMSSAADAPAVETVKPKSELFLMYFGADWCGPCKVLARLMEDPEIQKEIAKFDCDSKNGKPFPHYVDTDKQPHLTKLYNIQAIPTLIIVQIDDEEVKVIRRYVGSADRATLLKFLSAGTEKIDTSATETFIIPPVWTIKGIVLILFKIIKALIG